MKYSSAILAVCAMVTTGCASMFYGQNQAPVVQKNADFYAANLKEINKTVSKQNSSNSVTYSEFGQTADPNKPIDAQIDVQQPSPYGSQASPDDAAWAIKPGIVTDENLTQPVDPNAPIRPQQTEATVPTKVVPVSETQEKQQATQNTPNNNETQASNSAAAVRPVQQPQAESKQVTEQPKTEETQVASTTQQAPSTVPSNSASELIKKASAALGKGDMNGAASLLEEAQRLDSKNARISYDIANIRYHQGKYREAESAAGRAVQIGADSDVLKKSWSIIANSRKALGDNQGAISAAEKAASY